MSDTGQLLRRALDLQGAIRLGLHLCLDDVAADEFHALLILQEERDRHERESHAR